MEREPLSFLLERMPLEEVRRLMERNDATVEELAEAVAAMEERGEPLTGSPGFEEEGESENGFCEFCGFCGPDLSKNPYFPAVEFPRVLRNFTAHASESLQVPVDMPAVSALAAASLCTQRKFKVHTQARHFGPINLYTAIAAKLSERKSPTIALTMGPVYKYQHEENERRRPQVWKI